MIIYCDSCGHYVGDFEPAPSQNVAILEEVRCVTCQANGKGINNSTALSLSSAYREALEEIMLKTQYVGKLAQPLVLARVYHIARAALDRGKEEPLIESTLTDEQRKEIGETCRREVRESWEKIRGDRKPEEPVEREVTVEELSVAVLNFSIESMIKKSKCTAKYVAESILTTFHVGRR